MQTRLRLKTDSGSHWLTDLSAHSGWTHGCCGRAVGAAGSTLQGVTQGPFEVTIITSHWHRSAGYPKHLDIFSWKLAQPIEQHLTLKPAAYFKYVTGWKTSFFFWMECKYQQLRLRLRNSHTRMAGLDGESPTQTTSLRCWREHNDGIHISGRWGKAASWPLPTNKLRPLMSSGRLTGPANPTGCPGPKQTGHAGNAFVVFFS